MSGAGRKWAIGCGVGCGLMLLAAGGVGTCGYFAVRDLSERGDEINAVADEVRARFGAPADFVPPADGRIPADRVETFLQVRASSDPSRGEVSRILRNLDDGGYGTIEKIRMGMRIVPGIMDLVEGANRALLDQGMGPGEYQHMFVLSFYDLLGKDPADGPGFAVGDRDRNGFSFETRVGKDKEADARRDRDRAVRREINTTQLQILRNQLGALDAGEGSFADDAERDAWRTALAAEIAAMEADPRRLPWADGLPERIRESLEPFRDRLEASYDPMTGMFELGVLHDED